MQLASFIYHAKPYTFMRDGWLYKYDKYIFKSIWFSDYLSVVVIQPHYAINKPSYLDTFAYYPKLYFA